MTPIAKVTGSALFTQARGEGSVKESLPVDRKLSSVCSSGRDFQVKLLVSAIWTQVDGQLTNAKVQEYVLIQCAMEMPTAQICQQTRTHTILIQKLVFLMEIGASITNTD